MTVLTTPPTAAALPPAHILVVDDLEKNTRFLTDVLTAKGYRTSAALSGAQALELVDAEPPDLVLLDVMMPGMNGYEVCQRLRADPRHELLPVVLITALDPAAERGKGLDAGADDFLSKPINHAELLARVRSLLRVKRLQDQLLARPAAPVAAARRVDDAVVLRAEWPLLLGGRADATPAEALAELQALHTALAAMAHEAGGTTAGCEACGVTAVFEGAGSQPETARRAWQLAMRWQTTPARPSIGISGGAVTLGSLPRPDGGSELAAIGPAVLRAGRLCRAARAGDVLADSDLALAWAARLALQVEAAAPLAAEDDKPSVPVSRLLGWVP